VAKEIKRRLVNDAGLFGSRPYCFTSHGPAERVQHFCCGGSEPDLLRLLPKGQSRKPDTVTVAGRLDSSIFSNLHSLDVGITNPRFVMLTWLGDLTHFPTFSFASSNVISSSSVSSVRTYCQIFARMGRDSDFPRLRFVNILAMTAHRVPQPPTVILDSLDNVTKFHSAAWCSPTKCPSRVT
jgi:hypothetical protein